MRENYSIDDFNGVTNVHDVNKEGKRKKSLYHIRET